MKKMLTEYKSKVMEAFETVDECMNRFSKYWQQKCCMTQQTINSCNKNQEKYIKLINIMLMQNVKVR